MNAARPRLTIVGGGWAGLAAAVAAVQRGWAVRLFEATHHWGGRARSLSLPWPAGLPNPAQAERLVLDNGQHILIGAYTDTLRLMRLIGLDDRQLLRPAPLALPFPDGSGFAIPPWARRWPAPLDALAGMLSARGWTWRDRTALLATTLRWRRQGFRCPNGTSVAQLCHGLPPHVQQGLIEPLCVAALNTPAAQACGQTFLRVLRDALLGPALPPYRSADLLLPCTDLGRLWPDAAANWLREQGAELHLGQRIQAVLPPLPGQAGWRLWHHGPARASHPEDDPSGSALLLACPASDAARLMQRGTPAHLPASARDWIGHAEALRHEAIATVYVHSHPPAAWPAATPMLALRDGPAQFVFDRSQLGGPAGLLAFVASACQGDRQTIETQVLAQARTALGLAHPRALLTVVEKRATFACTPGLQRPGPRISAGLWAAGDAIDGPYPATLEGAVRSGLQAVAAIAHTQP